MSTWQIDPAHTDIMFSTKHMMVTTVRGKFNEVEGTLELDERDPTASHGEFRVRAASLDTGVERRDDHLRSADFFDADTHEWLTFTSASIDRVAGDDYRVTGDLTIRETTRPITFEVTLGGITTGLRGGRHLGLSASATLDREAWGLTWNMALETGGWLVGKDVKLSIEIAADEVESRVSAEIASTVA